MTIQDIIYDGEVKITALPKRELSPTSEYPSLVGCKGRIVRISGNKVGIEINNKTNKDSRYNCYWFDIDCIEKI